MENKRDYYEVLGINKNATDQDIKKAYRQLAKKYHPDANPGNKEAEEKFKEITEAYDVLSDPQKKQNYDSFGFDDGSSSFNGNGFNFNFDDMFGGFGDIFGHRNNAPRRGRDLQTSTVIDFNESMFGTKKEVSVKMYDKCSCCNGTGAENGSQILTCSSCRGTGFVTSRTQTVFGIQIQQTVCQACKGTGKFIQHVCSKCSGSGEELINKKFEIKIPAGVDNGQRIRLAGKGENGEAGPGDLYIIIYVDSDSRFKRDGLNLYSKMDVNFSDLVLGNEIIVDTIYGDFIYKLDECTKSGTVLKIKDKGAVNINDNQIHGDLFVEINAAVPDNINNELKNKLKEMKQQLPFI